MLNDEMCFALMLTAMRDQMMLDEGFPEDSEPIATAFVAHKLRTEPETVIRKAADLIDAYDERGILDALASIGIRVIVFDV